MINSDNDNDYSILNNQQNNNDPSNNVEIELIANSDHNHTDIDLIVNNNPMERTIPLCQYDNKTKQIFATTFFGFFLLALLLESYNEKYTVIFEKMFLNATIFFLFQAGIYLMGKVALKCYCNGRNNLFTNDRTTKNALKYLDYMEIGLFGASLGAIVGSGVMNLGEKASDALENDFSNHHISTTLIPR